MSSEIPPGPLSKEELETFFTFMKKRWSDLAEGAKPKMPTKEWFFRYAQTKEFLRRQSESFSLVMANGEKNKAYLWVRTKSMEDLNEFLVASDAVLEKVPRILEKEPFMLKGERVPEESILVLDCLRDGIQVYGDIHNELLDAGVNVTPRILSTAINKLIKLNMIYRTNKSVKGRWRGRYALVEEKSV